MDSNLIKTAQTIEQERQEHPQADKQIYLELRDMAILAITDINEDKELSSEEASARRQAELLKLNSAKPDWLTHDWNTKKNSLTLNFIYEKVLKMLSDDLNIIFNDEYPNGIQYNGIYWQPFSKDAKAKETIKSAVVFELARYGVFKMISNQELSKLNTYILAYMTKKTTGITFNRGNLVNFKNGTWDLDTDKGHSFTKDDYLTSALPVDMKQTDLESGGLVGEYARHLLGEDAQTLAEWFGYMFFKDAHTLNHVVFIQGVGGNGKSTLLRVLLSSFGEFGASISFGQLSGKEKDRYLHQLSTLYANILTESSESINSEGKELIKKISSGDQITANPKGRDTYSFYPRAKFLISANYRLPKFEDSKEYQRRLVLLSANAQSIDNMDDPKAFKDKYNEHDKLAPALPEYIGYAINQAKKAMARKELTINLATRNRTDAWLQSNDIVGQFVSDTLIPIDGKHGVSLKYLYSLFTAFISALGVDDVDIMKITKFGDELTAKGYTMDNSPTRGRKADAEYIDKYDTSARKRIDHTGVNKNV